MNDIERRLAGGLRDLAAHAPTGQNAERATTPVTAPRSHRPRPILVAVVAAAAVAAIGASGPLLVDRVTESPSQAESPASGPQASEVQAAPDVDIAAVRGPAPDYPGSESVVDAANQVPTAFQGEVVSWTDGRLFIESDGPEYEGISYISYNAVLKIRITQAFTDDPPAAEYAYVEIERGAGIKIDGEYPKDGSKPVVTSIDELNQAAPPGTPVIILGSPAESPRQLANTTPGTTVQNDGKNVPEGSSLMHPTAQGLLFRDETGAFVSGLADGEKSWGWIPDNVPNTASFDYLSDQLEQGID